MAKKTVDLDTPFRRGESVVATRDLGAIEAGTLGRVQLQNGLDQWRRYWVNFAGDIQLGQISHNDLTRPHQIQDWIQREAEQKEQLATKAAAIETEPTQTDLEPSGNGISAQIPAHLLERSKAAKARLLG